MWKITWISPRQLIFLCSCAHELTAHNVERKWVLLLLLLLLLCAALVNIRIRNANVEMSLVYVFAVVDFYELI